MAKPSETASAREPGRQRADPFVWGGGGVLLAGLRLLLLRLAGEGVVSMSMRYRRFLGVTLSRTGEGLRDSSLAMERIGEGLRDESLPAVRTADRPLDRS